MDSELEKSARLLKKELGLISLKDIEELRDEEAKMDPKVARVRAGDAELFYKKHFKKVLQLFIQKQLEEGVKEGDTIGKVLTNRGSVTGMLLIKEWFEAQINLSISRFDKEE